jgi:hypothetical protein
MVMEKDASSMRPACEREFPGKDSHIPMITFRKSGIVIGEAYFEESTCHDRVDIKRLVYWPCDNRSGNKKHVQTLCIDLTRNEDDLFAGVEKGTRYEIRRARDRDHVSCRVFVGRDYGLISDFCDFYDQFARLKDREAIFRPRLTQMANAERLGLTCAFGGEDNKIVWHAYYLGRARVRLLYSASLFRESKDSEFKNFIGRANRYLHWFDITAFKQMGYTTYDFGGIDMSGTNKEVANISDFKRGFGGNIVTEYCEDLPVSVRGRVALCFYRFLTWSRSCISLKGPGNQ